METNDNYRQMKHLLLTTIAAVLVVGCGESRDVSSVDLGQPTKLEDMIKSSMPPLNIAAEKGDLENVKELLNSKVDVDSLAQSTGETPLHHAVGKGHKKIAELLIVNGADVNGSGFNGNTPLHEAADKDHNVIAELLIANGANVNVLGKGGWTPLCFAAYEGHKEIAELLIDKGADVNTKDDTGRTPLHWVAFARKNEIVDLLIANDADVNAKDNEGKTPLYFAELTRHKAIAKLLRKHGGKTGEELKAEGK